ncbi:hydantoinase/oxoprolinase family protein [Geomesophilobacter sediminis]|uniref:Hydantoinase/oxoprolinase family protein n=1 Tax=Geomesophilobacter sediminis TaxID=2798584 RepID=A0A8J7M0P3_9BACT|nr:hydantoinase/oxoprolinase family protein [Geomesophilobacter sediminis]MBJ6726237.1 hydantoinase/oxoprolinase family protein [Geomesophilobacter sediminis]
MKLGLGIDTGGTFTDSVIVDLGSGRILSKSKAPTTREDLKVGVEASFCGLDHLLFSQVSLVSLSTTLATNSIVEGKGARVALLAAVPKPETFAFPGKLPAESVAIFSGAHDTRGCCSVPLDLAAAREAVRGLEGKVEAVAVSSYFSIYNAEHELRLRELVLAETSLPVVCGHELSGAVGMVERAVTATLNARLLPVIRELLDAVGAILRSRGIQAPLMVVKGDGSLISEEGVRLRPVETLLSGPAASIAGACRLSGLDDAIVVDMGGTTTDIGIVKGGVVATGDDGAVVGGWQTRVRAVDMWTVGLGGDSKIQVDGGRVTIGPRRSIPLCTAAVADPGLLPTLDALLAGGASPGSLEILTAVRRPAFPLSRHEGRLFELLAGRMVPRSVVDREIGPFVDLDRFQELGYLIEVGFTPTDFMHLNREFEVWDREASVCGAAILARQMGGSVEDFLGELKREISNSLSLQIAAKALHEEPELASSWSPAHAEFLGRLLQLSGERGISAAVRLSRPVIAVGAPVRAFLPAAAAILGAQLVIPEHAEVANAFGAVTGRVVEKVAVHVRPGKPDGFVVVSADVQQAFVTIEDAIAFAEAHAREVALAHAAARGGMDLEVRLEREETSLPLKSGWGDQVFIEVRVTATAVGTPPVSP